mmetsp:Transcript_19895/g.43148  ORF Transcript_19895/g.43148 Transcript_19895/m.43148 type:complete len:220 (-) Transcript_19895:167-826(-)|eukprot:CAMPEP_0172305834 /NCGR_PEP_ID=MMETSP1058-20130122/7053_1 /TAXON_ID=83371 /ORGANISM="Detonula confervacea, Strain CCMP 353" /LENGTH=219 /DNA_ID=CAMNT_0013017553 /DNA_START=157 /DNA_END=816 /DNA_ORIENTATION=+
MNLLLKLIASALVATSSVHAVEKTYVLRGSVDNEDVLVQVGSNCVEGSKDGKRTVDDLWRSMGEDCGDAFNLEKKADHEKNKKYPSSQNWKTDAFNECARDGVDQQVQKIEKDCLGGPSECVELGETAAELVVKDNYECTQAQANMHGASEPTDYKKECREVAYGICTGYIPTAVKTVCRNPKETLRTNKELRELQGKCEKQVNKMTGKGGDELKFMIN